MSPLDAVVKAYDIRGTVPDQLDASVCRALGVAFARFTGASRILIGRDMRPTGVELTAAFADGVLSQGVDVAHLGLCSTDLVYFASGRYDAPAVMITASHNPAQYNGVKLCRAGARPVGLESGLAEVKGIAQAVLDGAGPPAASSPGREEHLDALTAFADHVVSFIDIGELRPLKVVADTANGMGGLIVPKIFERLPVDLEVMYGELDGTFPNHPADPMQQANQRDLQARVAGGRCRPRSGLRRRRRPGVLHRRDRSRPVGLHDHGHARRQRAGQGAGRDDPAQLHLLAGRARGGARARWRARCAPGWVTRTSSR